MSKPHLLSADEIRIRSHIERLMKRWDETAMLPDGTEARIIERVYVPTGVWGNKPQILITVEPIPQEI